MWLHGLVRPRNHGNYDICLASFIAGASERSDCMQNANRFAGPMVPHAQVARIVCAIFEWRMQLNTTV
eukprot:1942890-Amphidinium_carterae.3